MLNAKSLLGLARIVQGPRERVRETRRALRAVEEPVRVENRLPFREHGFHEGVGVESPPLRMQNDDLLHAVAPWIPQRCKEATPTITTRICHSVPNDIEFSGERKRVRCKDEVDSSFMT